MRIRVRSIILSDDFVALLKEWGELAIDRWEDRLMWFSIAVKVRLTFQFYRQKVKFKTKLQKMNRLELWFLKIAI